jgi:hypothetical protein
MEIYRSLVDDFLIGYCKGLKKKDFVRQQQDYSSNRKGQREYLKKSVAKDMTAKLNSFFESKVEIPRIRHGNRQTLETLINEEALVLAKYLRNEIHEWVPRIRTTENKKI